LIEEVKDKMMGEGDKSERESLDWKGDANVH
jgi:hypothetical protein